jgi:CO/xanthine dehydrogenase Mo-binding subunit
MKNYKILNTRAPRVDAYDKVTGRALYTDDLKRPGLLAAALLHSPVAHAKILNIDSSRAAALPGVKAVVTYREAGTVPYGVSPARYDETIFCHDRVRYVGDEIAAVAAIDLDTALDAIKLIKVDFEELPIILDGRTAPRPVPQQHLCPGALEVRRRRKGPPRSSPHPDRPDNLQNAGRRLSGTPEHPG